MNEDTIIPVGTIVRSDRLHAVPFGTVQKMRKQDRTGRGWGRVEYSVTHDTGRWKGGSWIDENHLEVATLDDVLTYYMERERDLHERIKKLREMVGAKVPKYNPAKHLGNLGESDAYRHEDRSLTYVFYDPNPQDTESPRTYDGTVSTLIQRNTRCIDIDDDDAGLAEARERFTHALMKRYLAMFRPDIAYYAEHWSAGDSYGWGYVTREAWDRWMGEDYDGDVTPEQAFDAEVKVYGLWANGEVYGSCHVAKRGAEPEFVYGHLGYDDHKQIAANHTDSPILEVLA